MSLTLLLVNIACLGTEWVLWLLLGLSILSCQVALDRAYFFWRCRVDSDWLAKQMFHLLRAGDIAKAQAIVNRSAAPECIVLAAGLSDIQRGPQVIAQEMASAQARQRLRMEGEMNLLAMIATFAPIIGLMGTVLAAVNAVHGMSFPFSDQSLADGTILGLSEAIIATAAGLFVAVLAGVGHHFLQRRVQLATGRITALSHLLLAESQVLETAAAERRAAEALADRALEMSAEDRHDEPSAASRLRAA